MDGIRCLGENVTAGQTFPAECSCCPPPYDSAGEFYKPAGGFGISPGLLGLMWPAESWVAQISGTSVVRPCGRTGRVGVA